jgi:hypothetical protein
MSAFRAHSEATSNVAYEPVRTFEGITPMITINYSRLAVCAAALSLTSALVSASVVPQLPARYTNLQVLPKDITQDQLMSVMKGASQSLGVRCWYCHEGSGDDFATYDFAADAKEPKVTARAMLRLTSQINGALKDVGPHKGETGKVTCNTCHRGNKTPSK